MTSGAGNLLLITFPAVCMQPLALLMDVNTASLSAVMTVGSTAHHVCTHTTSSAASAASAVHTSCLAHGWSAPLLVLQMVLNASGDNPTNDCIFELGAVNALAAALQVVPSSCRPVDYIISVYQLHTFTHPAELITAACPRGPADMQCAAV